MKPEAVKRETKEPTMIIRNVRMAYCHLEKPRAAVEGAEPKYSVTLIIPKDHEQIAEIKAAIDKAKKEKWGGNVPKNLRPCLRDGDAVSEEGERIKGPEFAGAYFVTASSKRPVEMKAGKTGAPATSEHLRSGNYATIRANFFTYDTPANRGVGLGLNGVWVTAMGEPLGAPAEEWGSVQADDFSAIAEQAFAAGKQGGDIF